MIQTVFGNEAVEKVIKDSHLSIDIRSAENTIQVKDMPNPHVYIAVRGCVHEKEGNVHEHGAHVIYRDGEIFGAHHILPQFKDKAISNVATTRVAMASIAELDISSLRPLLEDKAILHKVWEWCTPTLIMLHPETFPKLSKMDMKPLKRITNKGHIIEAQPDEIIDLAGGGILWDGEIGLLKVCQTEFPNKLNDMVKPDDHAD